MGKRYGRKWQHYLKEENYRGAFLRMLPVLVMAGLVPITLRQSLYDVGLDAYPWYAGESQNFDLFLYAKSVLLTLLMFVMAVCVLFRFWKERRKLSFAKVLFPLLGYGVLCFLSACGSVNPTFSFSGGHGHFESVWVLLSYVLAVYYLFLYAQGEKELQVTTDALCFSTSVIGILGSLQAIGIDYIEIGWIQKLITQKKYFEDLGGGLMSVFEGKRAYATLYNPNYVGVFAALVLPLLAVLLLYEKSKWRRIWHGANVVVVLIALVSSESRAGLLAAAAAVGIAIVLSFFRVLKRWYVVVPAVGVAVVLVLLVNAYNDNILFARLKNILAPDEVKVSEYTTEDGTVVRETGLTQMYTTENEVVLVYNDVLVRVVMPIEDGAYGFYALDENGDQLALSADEEGTLFSFEHPALRDVTLAPAFFGEEQELCFCIDVGMKWFFRYDDTKGSYQHIHITELYETTSCDLVYGKLSDMIMAESLGFEKHQQMFSGRGYIWSRTLPLLKKHILLGSGPDTFIFAFPQEDYLMRSKNGYGSQLMSKPHCLYLQVAVQTGMLSLVCLLVFYGWYAVQSLRLYAFRKLGTQTEALGMAAFMGSIGYMIAGISNDSMVVTAPVFWVVMGVGVAANVLVKKQRKSMESSFKGETPGKE